MTTSRIVSQLRAPSLRQRFLVAPLLGLVLLILLTASFTYELQRQNALLTRVVEEDLVAFERYADIFIDLSEQHVALFDLLNSAPKSDEETLYDNAKQRLFAIQDATRKLREILPAMGSVDASAMAQRREALALIEAYRRAAISAVEMTTLNVTLAPREITLANQRFGAMNRAFEKLLDAKLDEVKLHVSDRVERNRARTFFVALGGISFAALLLALSVGLSRLLSRSLEAQIRLLGELEDPAQADTKTGGGDEVERIGRSIAAFRRTQLDLRESERRFRAAFDQAGVGMAERDIDPRNSRWLRVNQKLCDILGYTRDELLQLTSLDVTPPEDRDTAIEHSERLLKGEITSYSREKRYVRKDGRIIWANITLTAVSGPDGGPSHIISVIEDITGRKAAEENVKRLSRVRAVLSGINAAIVRIQSRQALFDEACRIAVDHGNFAMAWIGMLDAATQDVTPVAWAGEGAEEITRAKSSARDDTPRGKGAVGQAIRERRLVFNNDLAAHTFGGPRLKLILSLGFRSQITLPLFEDQTVVGTLTMYAREPDFVDEEELKLLTALVGDISFALEHMARQEKIGKLARIRAVSSEINAAIARIRERKALLEEVCRIAKAQGQFEMVWIAEIDPDKQQVEAVAWTGFTAEAARSVTWAAIGAAPATMDGAIKTRKVSVRNDIGQHLVAGSLRHLAVQQGCHSSVCLPVVVNDRLVVLISLFAAGRGFFDKDELALLEGVASDISFALQSIEKQERLDYLAYYDPLTGLANRSLFLERMAQFMGSAATSGHKLALFLFDLERFKNINDSLGRPAGDALLRQIAEWLTRNLGDANLFARVGADHFAIVLPKVKQEGDVARLVEKTMGAFQEHPFRLNDAVFRIAAKVGIAIFPDDGADADTLFRNAEAALKKAKVSGDRYLFHTLKMTEAVAGKLALENQLREALDNEEFVLHYQPKIDLASGAVCGLEALIRWQKPGSGLVAPGTFIPLLEETGLILGVGKWALSKALAQHREWTARGIAAPRIAVNVSTIQLQQKDFADAVIGALQEQGDNPDALEVEVTESLLMQDVPESIRKLSLLRGLGIHIAMDDFGTGHSSLSYLARLPLNSLKIDRSFITEMANNPQDMAMVTTIIALAHSLNLRVVAEGVETESQSKLLKLLRCDEAQGYLFSKPLPAEQIEPMLRVKAQEFREHGSKAGDRSPATPLPAP